MARWARSSYTFDKTNLNYINAIRKGNANVFITKLNGRDVSEQNYRGKDLLDVVNKTRAEEFNIVTVSGNSNSTVGVIPEIDKERLATAISDVLSDKDIQTVDDNVKKIVDYFDQLLRMNGFDVYIGPPHDIAEMTQSQSILLLDKLQKRFSVTGAMLFEDLNAILLQFNGRNLILNYGAKTSLKEMAMITLDIDDGFCTDRYDMQGEGKEVDKQIYNTLQAYFQKWKASDYTIELIPASGFKYGQSPTPRIIEPVVVVPAAAPAMLNEAKMREDFDKQANLLAQMQSLDNASLLASFGVLASNANTSTAPANEEKNLTAPKI